MIDKLNLLATEGRKPDLTFFLDLPVEIGLSRATDPNKFEKAGIEFQKKVRKGFLYAISKSKKRFRVLKVKDKTPEQVCELAVQALKNSLPKKTLKKQK